MKDTYRHKGLRRKLIEELRKKGISDESVLEVMGRIPRHFFLDRAFDGHAYENKAFPIGNKQTISQPYTVAYQTSMLEVKQGDKILEIGTGSGYQATVLAMLGAEVHTIERQEDLYLSTKILLYRIGLEEDVNMYYKDGFEGLPSLAPFDKIIVTAGANKIPNALLQQLAVGGRMVIPYGETEDKTMLCLSRDKEGNPLIVEQGGIFHFVPFLAGKAPKKS